MMAPLVADFRCRPEGDGLRVLAVVRVWISRCKEGVGTLLKPHCS